ncbi:MAG: hypothetical protein AAFO04_29515 [Cyanobacteria bacterium J06592_8]
MSNWIINGQDSPNYIPNYSAPQNFDINTTASDVIPAGAAGRVASISVTSDSSIIWVAFGMDVQPGVFWHVKLPPGYNNNNFQISAQKVSMACDTGKTAKVSIGVAG